MKYAVMLLLLILAACAKKQDSKFKGPSAAKMRPSHYYSGDLRQAYADMTSSDALTDSCDQVDDPKISKILDKLDAHKEEIAKHENDKASLLQSNGSFVADEIFVGQVKLTESFYLKETKMTRAPKTEVERREELSWSKLMELIEASEMTPQNWAWVNSVVRQIFPSEFSRRLHGRNLYTSPEQWVYMQDFLAAANRCLEGDDCNLDRWKSLLPSAEHRAHVDENPFLQKTMNDTVGDEDAYRVKYLKAYLVANIEIRSVTKNEGVLQTQASGENIFTVGVKAPSDLSVDAKSVLQKHLESFWVNDHKKVKINWLDSNNALTAFAFVLHNATGRAYVNVSKLTLNLYQADHVSTLLHEFGHVLGLPDRYYEFRDVKKCQRYTIANESDIMSRSMSSSKWLDSDWEEFKKTYPIQ